MVTLAVLYLPSVWDLVTGKVLKTFKHRHPVMAVAMNEDLCVSGCEGGRVKVWDVKSSHLIKVLHYGGGHPVKYAIFLSSNFPM